MIVLFHLDRDRYDPEERSSGKRRICRFRFHASDSPIEGERPRCCAESKWKVERTDKLIARRSSIPNSFPLFTFTGRQIFDEYFIKFSSRLEDRRKRLIAKERRRSSTKGNDTSYVLFRSRVHFPPLVADEQTISRRTQPNEHRIDISPSV